MSQPTIFQSCRDGATASWVINQYFRGVKCLAQGHNTAAVGFEPPTSRSGVRHSTTEPPRSPYYNALSHLHTNIFLSVFALCPKICRKIKDGKKEKKKKKKNENRLTNKNVTCKTILNVKFCMSN